MANYAITVVPADWEPDQVIGFSEAAYKTWRDKIKPGTRVLIYKGDPVNAIVGEAEVLGAFARLADWPQTTIKKRPLTATGEAASHVMPLQMLYMRADANRIPYGQVRERITDPAFPNVEWLPIEEDDYHVLANWP